MKEDYFTSIHIDEFEIEIRETKLGREEFTRDIPNVPERALKNLDEDGIVRVGTRSARATSWSARSHPRARTSSPPEEKLLHAIFGRAGEDVKNDSSRCPSGVEGIVIDTQKFSRKVNMTEEERQKNLAEIKKAETRFLERYRETLDQLIERLSSTRSARADLVDPTQAGDKISAESPRTTTSARVARADPHAPSMPVRQGQEARHTAERGEGVPRSHRRGYESEKTKLVNRLSRGDELPTGVLEMVKVFIATKRQLSVGDKIAGRHGNKGVIARMLPESRHAVPRGRHAGRHVPEPARRSVVV